MATSGYYDTLKALKNATDARRVCIQKLKDFQKAHFDNNHLISDQNDNIGVDCKETIIGYSDLPKFNKFVHGHIESVNAEALQTNLAGLKELKNCFNK